MVRDGTAVCSGNALHGTAGQAAAHKHSRRGCHLSSSTTQKSKWVTTPAALVAAHVALPCVL